MDIKQKLTQLRQEWKENPDKRATIEVQAKILKMAMTNKSDYQTPREKKQKKLLVDAAETLL